MSVWRKLCVKVWTDDKIRVLPNDAKQLFVYLLTAPTSHSSGCYYLRPETIAEHLTLEPVIILEMVDRLELAGLVRVDRERWIWWVVKMAKYQASQTHPRYWKGVASHLEDLPASPVIEAFRTAYAAELAGTPASPPRPDTPSDNGAGMTSLRQTLSRLTKLADD